MDTKQRIRTFLGKFLDQSQIGDEQNIFESGLVNSLFAMQVVTFIEKEFDIALSNEELDIDNFKDINSLEGLINSKLRE